MTSGNQHQLFKTMEKYKLKSCVAYFSQLVQISGSIRTVSSYGYALYQVSITCFKTLMNFEANMFAGVNEGFSTLKIAHHVSMLLSAYMH